MDVEINNLITKKIEDTAMGIRRRALGLLIDRGEGYISQACSSAELFSVLYNLVLKLNDVKKPIIPDLFVSVPNNDNIITGLKYHGEINALTDRFFLSATQYSVVLYCALVEVNRMDPIGLEQFNIDGSSVEMIGAAHSPGMEIMSGSLGQTLSQAVGVALARKLKGESGRVVVFMGDGECQSGQTWEAIQCINNYKLDNMLMIVDVNGYQVDGSTEEVMDIRSLSARFKAFGMEVHEIDAHDINAINNACIYNGKPTVVVAFSDICRGLDVLRSRRPKYHFVRFLGEEEKIEYIKAYKQMMPRDQ
ncbi:hypothetical protein MASR2M78_12970 [Treponema sp.]